MSTEEIEKSEMLLADKMSKPDDTYRVYSYLEQHNTLLIAAISALVAIISALISTAAYIYQKLILHGWNIDFRIINFSVKGQLYYYILFSLIYIISIMLFSNLTQKIFNRYIQCKASVTYYKYILKKLRKQSALLITKEFKTKKRNLKKAASALSEETTNYLTSLSNKDKDFKNAINDVRRDVRVLHKTIAKNMLPGLLSSTILLFPIMFAYQIATANSSWPTVLISWVLCSGITMSFAYIRARQANKDIAPKKIKEEINKSWPSDRDKLDGLKKRILKNVTEQAPPWAVKQTLSDQSLSRIALNLFSVFVTLFLAISLTGLFSSAWQIEYWIYTDELQQYVVAYQDETQCVLKQAEIDDNRLIINTSRQKIVNNDNIILVSRKFSKVEKISEE